MEGFPIDCTGDLVEGDVIRFEEVVYEDVDGKPEPVGIRIIVAQVVREDYDLENRRFLFWLRIIFCEGADSYPVGLEIERQARSLYRKNPTRRPWSDEGARAEIRIGIAASGRRRGMAPR